MTSVPHYMRTDRFGRPDYWEIHKYAIASDYDCEAAVSVSVKSVSLRWAAIIGLTKQFA